MLELDTRRRKRLHRGPRPVGRQLQLRPADPPTRSRPVPELLEQQRLRIVLRAQHLALPQRVIRVLHRQRRPARRLAAACAPRTPPSHPGANGAIEHPSPAMWCTTTASTCSVGAELRNSRDPQPAPPRDVEPGSDAARPPLARQLCLGRRPRRHRHRGTTSPAGTITCIGPPRRPGSTVRSTSCRPPHRSPPHPAPPRPVTGQPQRDRNVVRPPTPDRTG